MIVIYDAKFIEVPEETFRIAKHRIDLVPVIKEATAKYHEYEPEKIEHTVVKGRVYCKNGKRMVLGFDDTMQEAVGLREEAFESLSLDYEESLRVGRRIRESLKSIEDKIERVKSLPWYKRVYLALKNDL